PRHAGALRRLGDPRRGLPRPAHSGGRAAPVLDPEAGEPVALQRLGGEGSGGGPPFAETLLADPVSKGLGMVMPMLKRARRIGMTLAILLSAWACGESRRSLESRNGSDPGRDTVQEKTAGGDKVVLTDEE